MKLGLVALAIVATQQLYAQNYQQIHDKAIVVDSHNDILYKSADRGYVFDRNLKGITHGDLDRLRAGGIDVQVFSVWCDGDKKNPFNYALRLMDSLDAITKRNPGKIAETFNSKDIAATVKQHKLAGLFGVEGGHMIENDLDKIDVLYKRGARYLTLTWNNSTPWASSAFDETFSKTLQHKGLNDFGKQVVKRMNSLGMMVDVSHVGEATFWDIIATTTKPIIASHSSVYNLCHHQRNLKDDQIRAIAKNGGVIQVNFFSGFLDSTFDAKEQAFLNEHKTENDEMVKKGMQEYAIQDVWAEKYTAEWEGLRTPLATLINHIDYIVKMVGVDYVGLGSDFDGITSPPQTLDDVTCYPLVTKALLERGYSKKDVTKILGGNFLRVLKANENK